jgi:hypothetical protein
MNCLFHLLTGLYTFRGLDGLLTGLFLSTLSNGLGSLARKCALRVV